MDEQTEAVWRKALQARGKDWVMSELHRRPGLPEDALYDVVFKEPYPTRAFCFEWCSEEENRLFRMSWHTYAAVFALLLLIVCLFKGVTAWNDTSRSIDLLQAKAMNQATRGVPAAGSSSTAVDNTLTNDIPTMATSSDSGASSGTPTSGGATSGQNTLPSVCGYITYDTLRCKVQN